jgi:tetratricopeptide (TPR) repeat protein
MLLAQPLARGESPETRARQLFEHAEALYALTRFDEALGEYEKAFEVRPLPGFLFNIGQCHRQLQHWDKAAYFYRAYLERQPHARNRSIVESLIAEVNEKRSDGPSARATAGAVVPPGADLRGDVSAAPGGSEHVPLYRRWYLWGSVGGVLLVGAGVGLGVGLGSRVDLAQGTLSTIDAR